jgi:hypothetical protein
MGAREITCKVLVSNTTSAGFSQPLLEITMKRRSGDGTMFIGRSPTCT